MHTPPSVTAPVLTWHVTEVDGRPARYLAGGSGETIVFLHGWGIAGGPLYLPALELLSASGYRILAPSLPGFGSADLPDNEFDLSGFAKWIKHFVRVVGVNRPVTVVGYSFGGGIAIRFANDFPGLVARLMLLNPIGGSTWYDRRQVARAIHQRPLWDWVYRLGSEIMPARFQWPVHSPRAIWRAGRLARTADLTSELHALRRRGLPIAIVWSRHDSIIPAVTIASLRDAAEDAPFILVDGNHSWMTDDPQRFRDVITSLFRRLPLSLPNAA